MKYFAFISYKREDEKWAVWLQHKLEHYKLPSNLNGRTDLPKEIRPIFRDQSELAAGVLADEIKKALTDSKYLIVICSPRAAQSQWVGKEVQTFIDLGRTDKIIPFIIGGTAHAENPEDECFPLALLNLPPEQELLGVNIDEMGRDAAAVKVVAQMFGLKFDALWQRYEREKRKRRNWIVLTFLVICGTIFWIWQQNRERMENQSRFVAEKARSIAEEDSYLARLLAIEVLPKNLNHPDRPYTFEAEMALRESVCYNSAILRGHTSAVRSASFSSDGKQIISVSSREIIIWDAESGEVIPNGNMLGHLTEKGLSGGNSAAFSPDGRRIVSTSNSNISIYGIESVYDFNILKGHTSAIHTATFSPDGKRIVSASDDNTVRIWGAGTFGINTLIKVFEENSASDSTINMLKSAKNDTIINVLKGHTSAVFSATYSLDGKRIVSASDDKTIRIWNAESGEIIKVLEGHTSAVRSATFSPDGKRIVSASDDKTIRIWDVESGEIIKILEGHTSAVRSATFSPDGKRIVSASDDKTIRIWDAESGEVIKVLKGHASTVFTVAFSPDGKRIVSASDDKTVRIWDVASEEVIVESDKIIKVFKHNSKVTSAVFSPDGKRIASVSEYTISIWDAIFGTIIKNLYSHFPNVAFFSPDGKLIVSASNDNTVKIWDVESGEIIKVLEGHTSVVRSATFSPDGKHIISTSDDKTIRIWDVESGEIIKVLEGHTSSVNVAVFSPDGKRIASASWDNTVRIWDVESGEIIKVLGHTDCVNSVSFSPNGKRIVSISLVPVIWDVESGAIIKKLNTYANAASFSPDGKLIVSASNDNTVRIWDVESGAMINLLEGHSSAVRSALFSFDGKRIVSASEDRTIRIWGFPPLQDLIDQTRERFKNRPLTAEERRMYYLE